MLGTPQKILTVSELTLLVRDRLEQGFPDLWIEGEVSNLRTPGSGHLYFTLKDQASQIRAILFRTGAQRLRFTVREGVHVIVRGRLTVYEPRGEYQIVLDYLEPKGIGALQIAFEQLKEKLAREGLFDSSRKRPLPLLPRCIGVITSLSGAAIQDILTVLHRRCSILKVLIHPVAVQGDAAAEQIARAIRALSLSGDVDVIIVGRGGGSWEDLWCFNDEQVVRAIAASHVPVVSAIGHEMDYTLADFASDYRAPTPSAAAEAVAPVLQDLVRMIQDMKERQERAMRARVDHVQRRVADHCGAIALLLFRIQRYSQQLDDAAERLRTSFREYLENFRQRVQLARHHSMLCSPRNKIRANLLSVPYLIKRVEECLHTRLAFRRERMRSLASALDSLSPLATLARGYSIVQTVPDSRIVRKASDVAVHEQVGITLAEGRLRCEVRYVLPDSRP
ncbi:exodeoxyribonuclease VII large subunit [Nitrospira sp. Nam74]